MSALQTLLPVLANGQVRGFRDDGGCRVIDYDRGFFSNASESPSQCPSEIVASPFDDQARADWGRVRQAIVDAGVSVPEVSFVQFDSQGRVRKGTFEVRAGLDVFDYSYDPAGTDAHEDVGDPHVSVNQAINAAWWIESVNG